MTMEEYCSELIVNPGTTIRSRSGINYRILQFLGAGGNSKVFLSLALNGNFHGVLFAFKIFTKLANPKRLKRFEQETEFLRKCEHPSIMRIYDNGIYSSTTDSNRIDYPFVIIDYLPTSLHKIIHGKLTTAERMGYTLQLLSCLMYLDHHNPSVIHRDIKPKNIFINGQSCVLGDFGLMKFTNDSSSDERQTFLDSSDHGMPYFYRSPDLVLYAQGKIQLSTKSDVFQLGLVLAEMFTGKNPSKPVKSLLDPVDLDQLRYIPGALGKRIKELIENMIETNIETRPSSSDLIDAWEGLFREVVDRSHALNGRIF